MRPGFRLLLLLIVSLLLRGFAGDAFALHLPSVAAAPMATSEHQHCPETPTPAKTTEHGKSCQINCDLAAAATLPVFLISAASPLPAVRIPTRPILAIGDLPAPDHPPPIL
jgi:hypothetical protein